MLSFMLFKFVQSYNKTITVRQSFFLNQDYCVTFQTADKLQRLWAPQPSPEAWIASTHLELFRVNGLAYTTRTRPFPALFSTLPWNPTSSNPQSHQAPSHGHRWAWLYAWDVLTCLRAHDELPKLETLHALLHLQPTAAQEVLWRFTKYYEETRGLDRLAIC